MPNYLDDPNWLPFACDVGRGEIVFAHIPREAHRETGFLDARFIGDKPRSPPMRVSESELASAPGGKLHFIFHTASCCSTLMARALDAPGVSMGLKEPSVAQKKGGTIREAGYEEETAQALH